MWPVIPKHRNLKPKEKKIKLHQNYRYKPGPLQAIGRVPPPIPPTHIYYSSYIPLRAATTELCTGEMLRIFKYSFLDGFTSLLAAEKVHTSFWEVEVSQVCPTLCDPMDYTVHGILQARMLEWIAVPFSRGSSQPRNWTQVSLIAGRFFTSWATTEALVLRGSYFISPKKQEPAQALCVELISLVCVSHSVMSDSFNPMDCSPPSSSVHGILQARILEWVTIPFSMGTSWPKD